jgi:hypothetical protein
MAWVIERAGQRPTSRGWRPATPDAGTKYPTQGEAQEAMDELMANGLAALGGKLEIKETP